LRDIAEDEDGVAPLEVQNGLLRYILTQQDIRDYVLKWGKDRRDVGFEDYADDEPELEKNNQFERVANEARSYLNN
jgi:predicted nucleotidyltransferase